MTPFARDVVAVLADLPPGQVVTYGEVAAQAGRPMAARGVGRVLRTSARAVGLPWWRVVDARGRLAPGKEREQAQRLRAEGVDCRDGFVVMVPAEVARTCDGGGAPHPGRTGAARRRAP